jgi:hypothetical protein
LPHDFAGDLHNAYRDTHGWSQADEGASIFINKARRNTYLCLINN